MQLQRQTERFHPEHVLGFFLAFGQRQPFAHKNTGLFRTRPADFEQFGTLCLFCQRSVQFFERLPERLQRGHESLALRDLVNCHPVHAFRQR